MKHTLKTVPRPNFTVHETKAIAMQYAIDVEAWLQGFEEELRQLFDKHISFVQNTIARSRKKLQTLHDPRMIIVEACDLDAQTFLYEVLVDLKKQLLGDAE